MKRLLLTLLLVCGLAHGQITTTTGAPPILNHTFSDDSYVQIPLQFGFPFYGRTFTNSWMHSNGVVSFLDPAVPVNNRTNPGAWAYCCEGVPPSATRPEFSYMIAPLWTDLYPVGQSRFQSQGNAQFQRYYWENIAEISNMNNLNTFGLEIRPSGFIGAYYHQVNIQNQNTWVGTIGDPTQGQYNQIYYGRGIPAGALNNWSMDGTGVDPCTANPLSSPTCPGYTVAMCTANSLYSPQCPGYQQAYFSQQCGSNPLYDINCPGYASAYLTYQCSVDPLYSTTCDGYESAYHDQQCSIDPLYARDCTGYTTAYHDQQCSLSALYATDCPGYGAAYLTQQCNADSLYSTQCPNYTSAYKTQQCSLNALYATDCPGYQVAYFNQQCTASPLYDKTCPGYAEAYALKYVVVATPTTTVATTTTTTTTAAPTTDSSGAVAVAVVSDPVVNQVVTTTATSASPAQSATATVPLVSAPAPVAAAPSQSTTPAPVAQVETPKEQPKTARQEMQAKREAAARTAAVEKGKNLANEMGKSADMESQKQVQNVVIQAMGFTPGFDAYGKAMIPDTVGYRPYTVYNNQKNVDNRRVGMGLYGPSDRLHNDLVNSQYKE